jgi:hypothetical protein
LKRIILLATASALIIVIGLSIFLGGNLLAPKGADPEFYVGIEYAYSGEVSELKALVDKVKGYTNLFVIGSLPISLNRTALDESCDYIVAAGLDFMVFFTSRYEYNYTDGYTIMQWMSEAREKYGDKFLGIYKIDEPGGCQLENGPSQIINDTATYAKTSQYYTTNLSLMINYYHPYTPSIFTADFGLEWFDYKANYTGVFAEFVGNESRERIIGLDRGAATAFGKDWGVIINWKYHQAPYLESGEELYNDLVLAYSAGAKYIILFSYPDITPYGIIDEEHFDALERFWATLHADPESFGNNTATVAYVVPRDYGFGFRNPEDRIWGLFPPDELSAKIYWDVENLTAQYGAKLDILYDEPELIAPLLGRYSQVYWWNQTLTLPSSAI